MAMENYYVCLADADPEQRSCFKRALEQLEFDLELDAFKGAEELLDFLEEADSLPEIIFLNLNMPCMDGGECLARIRSEERYEQICIVLYSSNIEMRRIEELFRNGANRYLRRPESDRALKKALRKTLGTIRKNPLGGLTVINCSE